MKTMIAIARKTAMMPKANAVESPAVARVLPAPGLEVGAPPVAAAPGQGAPAD